MENNSQTITCTKVSDNLFKLSMHNGFKYADIYKTKEELNTIIEYFTNVMNDRYVQWDISNETQEKIDEYNNL